MDESIKNGKISISPPIELTTIICTCGMEFVLLYISRGSEEITVYEQAGFYFCPYCGVADYPRGDADEEE